MSTVRGTRGIQTIGLTGGIGAGKSTVARRLAELGARVIDADKVGHEIYLPGLPAHSALVEAFGRGILAPDGTIDRRKLGARVFASPDDLAKLNGILHPRMAEEMRRRIDALREHGETAPIVLEAAVLLEAGWRPLVDELWVVSAPVEAATLRIARDRGVPREVAERRIASQLSNAERERRADVVIENRGSPEALVRRVDELWNERLA